MCVTFTQHTQFVPTDTDYISTEELAKVDKMLNHLSEESKQAAATTLVSAPVCSPCSAAALAPGRAALGYRAFAATVNCRVPPTTAHQRGRPVPYLLRTPYLSHLQTLFPQVMQVSSFHV